MAYTHAAASLSGACCSACAHGKPCLGDDDSSVSPLAASTFAWVAIGIAVHVVAPAIPWWQRMLITACGGTIVDKAIENRMCCGR